ncbi:MAG: hypothetical protein CME65_04660 [Halobacteriovoraceae bacterium]|nr:hypothetical protein [Halobacteriovoraceae bacterium]
MRIILSLVLFALSLQVFAHSSPNFLPKAWKIMGSLRPNNMALMMKNLSDLDIDVAGVDVRDNIIDVLLTDNDYKKLSTLGYSIEILEVKGVTKSPDEEYKNPEEIEQIVLDYYQRYPQLTERVSIGKSLEGRDIWALKISDNPNLDETQEPTILFNSMHHAREVMTPEVAIDIIDYLLSHYGQDAQVTDWVDKNQIWVIPMLNVDGNNKMWTSDRWWRKNTRGGYGVDINRNYPLNWKKCGGSSGSRWSQTYRGESAGSEPETQAMMKFVGQIKPVFNISYHAYSEIVIYPYGCNGERVARKEIVESIGKDIGTVLNYEAGTAWELLYSVDGGDIDWMYDAYEVIPYVIEVNSRKQGFQPDYNQWRDITVKRNRPGWMLLLDRLNASGVRGKINSNFKEARIDILSNGRKVHSYRVHSDGTYHIVLKPGSYDLNLVLDNSITSIKSITVSDSLERIEL